MSEKVHVGVTVIPSHKVAHVEVFENQEDAEAYTEYAEQEAPDGVAVWVQNESLEVTESFGIEEQ